MFKKQQFKATDIQRSLKQQHISTTARTLEHRNRTIWAHAEATIGSDTDISANVRNKAEHMMIRFYQSVEALKLTDIDTSSFIQIHGSVFIHSHVQFSIRSMSGALMPVHVDTSAKCVCPECAGARASLCRAACAARLMTRRARARAARQRSA